MEPFDPFRVDDTQPGVPRTKIDTSVVFRHGHLRVEMN
jgi:hypothetical protein